MYVAGNVVLSGTIDTGQGATEVYLMNQNVRTTDAVTFATVDTGQGANELYAMNQNVRTTDAVTFATVDTGQGATEVHLMNQNLRTTDNVTFNQVTSTLIGNATTATTALYLNVQDTRASVTTPQTQNANQGVRFDFKQNSTNGLSDGGTYNGVMYFRKYGSSTDWSGGGANELGFTDNGNMWLRYGSSTTWGAWKRIMDTTSYSFAANMNQNVRTTDNVVFNQIIANSGGNGGAFYLGDTNAGMYRDNTYDVVLLQNNSSGNILHLAGAGDVRVSIDSNNNQSDSKFVVGNNAIKSTNELFYVNESGYGYFASNVTATGNLHTNRNRVAFSSTPTDANHSIYNNYNNIDGEGGWDGMKMNVYNGLRIRTGNASGAVPTQIVDINASNVSISVPLYFTNYLYGNSKQALDTTDAWLRLNQANQFSNGTYTPYLLRSDGGLQSYGSTIIRNNYSTSSNLKLDLNDASAYGLVDFQLNGSHKGFFGLGGSSQSFGSYAAYAADGFSWNHDGSGKMLVSARSSRVIDLNTGAEGSSNFATIRMSNQDVFITPDSQNGTFRSPTYYVSNDTTYLWNSNRIVVNQVTFPYREWDYSWGAHGNGSGTQSMSFRMWDSYTQGGAPSSYGTLIEYYGLGGHQHDQYYFYQGEILHRYGWYGTTNWQSGWRAMLHAGNYGSYAIPISGGINMTGSFGLNDQRLYLRTNGDTNHFIWNADDDWEELRFYTGTGFRVQSSTGQVPATFTNSGINASNVTIGGAQVWYNSGGWMGDLASYGFTRRWGLQFGAGAEFVIMDRSGQGYTLIDGSYYAYESGGFYSSNNSSYGTLVGFNNGGGVANFNGPLRINTNNNIYLDYNYGQSVVGVYTSTRYQGVFSMGDAYKPAIDGSNPGNLYGIAWSHPNAGGQASYLNDHGALIMNYGTTFAAISSRIWARDQMNAPIYYDRDTGYYFDGNGESNWQGLTLRGKAQTGLTGKTNWKRPDITGDSNYWVGSMGWGTRDLNEVMTWGSGFFDTWSNPANQPSGTSHWVGVQTSHYTNAYNSMYGWQMCGGPISNLRFRNSWPSASGWTTIAMHDRNDGSGGALYAGIYYDSNDTSRYCDPNGFSYFSQTGLVLEVVKTDIPDIYKLYAIFDINGVLKKQKIGISYINSYDNSIRCKKIFKDTLSKNMVCRFNSYLKKWVIENETMEPLSIINKHYNLKIMETITPYLVN